MLGPVLRHLRPARPRRLVPLAVVLLGCGVPALAGVITGDPMLSGGALGILAAALPPALIYACTRDRPPEGGGGTDDGGSPDEPPRPDGDGGDSDLDWTAFDAERRAWERARARA